MGRIKGIICFLSIIVLISVFSWSSPKVDDLSSWIIEVSPKSFRLPLSLDPEISQTSDAGILPWRVCTLAGEWETTPSPEPPPSDPNKVNLPIQQAIKEDADSSACFGGLTKVMRGVENVVFLGDSTTKKMFHSIAQALSLEGRSEATRCGTLDMMGVAEEDMQGDWVLPDLEATEGPLNFGLCGKRWCNELLEDPPASRKRSEKGVGCTDCSGCAMEKADWSSAGKRFLFIPVEFARDVAQQSSGVRTTQEQVGRYLSREYRHAACFVTAGFHDQMAPGKKGLDTGAWREHMKAYVKEELLGRGGCKVVVVMTLTAVLGIKKFDQTNEMGTLLNGQLVELEKEGFEEGWGSQGRFGILDLYEASDIRELHSDNVHLNPFFYGEVARLIFGLDKGE